ncbi:ABC transporter permease [Ammoniphilus sp. 3BR4]|uniref:ABC transporter permease n=1 Tax=Ammoniphilus sp. 3BR4 TaxID=3158265 RepID=UPI003467632B
MNMIQQHPSTNPVSRADSFSDWISEVSKKPMFRYSIRLLSVAAFFILWQWAVAVNLMWPLQFGNLPTPLEVFASWSALLVQQEYYFHIGMSIWRVVLGIAIGLAAAIPLGLWIGLSRTATDTCFTILEIFRPVPLIAYLPVAMLLFSTIESSIVFITFIGAFFPILINVRDAVERVPQSLVNAARCLGCSASGIIWRVYLPAMGSQIFTGLAVGVGASWMGVITAEIMSGKHGIGYFTWTSYNLMEYEHSFIGIFTIGALGFLSSALVRLAERKMVK